MRHRRPSFPSGPRRASVLVIVLVTLLFASVALIAFVERASDDLVVDARAAAGRRLRQEAYSALEVTLAVLEDFRLANNGLRSPAEGWADPLGFAGWTPREGCVAEISFADESGKLSLPHVDLATFLNLFEGWGIPKTDAERLADALLGWMKKDHVPASSSPPDYDHGPLPYNAPLRPMRSYSELAAVEVARDMFYDKDGQPNELWQRFVDTISLLDFKSTNLNGAGGDVFTALGPLDPSQQKQLGEFLAGTGGRAQEGPAFFDTTADAAGLLGLKALPQGYGTLISALRINVTIREGRTNFRLSVVVAPSGGATVVQTVAATATDNARPSATGQSSETNPTAPSAPAAAAPKKLKYPFTLLEIRENAEISAVPPPAPQA